MSSGPSTRPAFPAEGPGSIASLGRRLIAVAIDWGACLLITYGLIANLTELSEVGRSFVPLLVFFVENLVMVAFGGSTFGHRLLGMQVIPVARPHSSVLQSAIRAALICLVIPAVIFDRTGRGLHDLAAGTALVRTR